MTKQQPPSKNASVSEASNAATQSHPAIWQLKIGTANKLGKYAEGGIDYQVTSDAERSSLFIAITANNGGGYFSRERVPFFKVEACVSKCESGNPFPTRALKDAFEGRSSNNAGFIVAVLRAEGLLGPAPEAENQHVITGDWAAWKKAMLAQSGVLIEPSAPTPSQSLSATPLPEHSKAQKQVPIKKP